MQGLNERKGNIDHVKGFRVFGLNSSSSRNKERKYGAEPATSKGTPKQPRLESHIDHDMVIEILLRLPVNSLERFQCVCRTWGDIISDSYFVMKHAKRSSLNLKLLVSTDPPQSIDYEALKKHDHGHGLQIASSIQLGFDSSEFFPDRHLTIVGSCDGLICLRGPYGEYSDVLLWNPGTRKTNLLPKVSTCVQSWYFLHPWFYGFGYDSTTEDYKVILGQSSDQGSTVINGFKSVSKKIAVFTLKTGSWRTDQEWRANPVTESVRLAGQGRLLNGALHWIELAFECNPRNRRRNREACLDVLKSRIISFDLYEEKFQEIVSLSNFVEIECLGDIFAQDIFAGIGSNVEDCLVLFFYNRSHTGDIMLTIWVMKEYGVEESWTKLIQIPSVTTLHTYQMCDREYIIRFPVYILEGGEILISCKDNELILYNPKRKTNGKFVLETILSCEGVVYAETLISPGGRGA